MSQTCTTSLPLQTTLHEEKGGEKEMANKVTKRQLLSSALALTVSGTMLLGTTMAWFTDSVTTGVNVIQTGKLKIAASVDGTDLKDQTTVINLSGENEVLNPGKTVTKEVRVENKGTVDATVTVTAVSKEENVIVENGNESNESSHSTHLEIGQPASKTIKAGTADTFNVVFGLSTKCELQEATLKAELKIQADQLQNVVKVTNATELETALASAESGTYINLVNTEIFSKEAVTYTVPDGVTLDGGIFTGKTALKVGNNAVIKNVTMENVTGTTGAKDVSGIAILVTGKSVTLDNVNVTGSKYAVRMENADGTHTITNCNFDAYEYYAFNFYKTEDVDTSIEFTNTTFKGFTSYASVKSVSFTNCTFKDGSVYNVLKAYATTTLNNCTFESKFKYQPVVANIEMRFNDCTYINSELTSKHLQSLADTDQHWKDTATIYLGDTPVTIQSNSTQQ
jgi:predicted ribosomally synthesized peptide with SipW-like signal peptide